MRTMLMAMLVVLGIGLLGTSGTSAAPANGAAIGAIANATMVEPVHCRPGWPHHRRGWDGCVRGPAYIAPVVPFVAPRCRSVRVCGPYGCRWTQRCR